MDKICEIKFWVGCLVSAWCWPWLCQDILGLLIRCIEESSSISLNKNKIFWPFVTQRMNIMLWLIQKTSTLAKRKFSWWAKKRWILQSQFRGGRGKSYLFDIFFRKSIGPNKIFSDTLRFQLKSIGKCWTFYSSLF